MRLSVDLWQTLSRFALIGIIGGLAGACSETARFSGNPFSNPFAVSSAPSEPSLTGSVADPAKSAVQSQPLAPPRASASAPAYNAPPAAAAPRTAALPTGASRPAGQPGWSAQGGTPITVGAGDSLNAIATRYGIPASAILSANGLSSASQVTAGRQIVIPVYNAAGLAPVASAKQPEQPKIRLVETSKPAPQKAEAKQRIRPGQTTKAAQVKPEAKAAAARLPDPKPVKAAAKTESQPVKQVAKIEAPKPKEAVKPAAKAEAQKLAPATTRIETLPAKPEKVATLPPAPKPAPQLEPVKPAPEVSQTGSVSEAPAKQAALGFRWPARGRVISGFGGNGNEGINIAVPEGTPVKAAEEGTVAYAGSEVKGYGKLVLIRHDNGHVSAYAHNGELNVKPGEKVKRGQTIAKSGQTGNVTSPQLHFEIRKGSTPIDPMPHLTGG
jgi:murein DD-endopeptidase MepM/ murein hydrolase activator NlpD